MGIGRLIRGSLRVPSYGPGRAIIVLVVLAVAATTGSAVSLTAPALVAHLGLTTTEPAAAPPVPEPVLGPLAAAAPLPTAAGLTAALDPLADAMPGRFTGTVLDPAAGTVLWERTADRALAPGSTGKLLTAAAALLTLSPTDGMVTRVVAGRQPGTAVLVGGGDPTLSTLPEGEDSVYPDAPHLAELADEVRAAAPEPITTVLVDTSRYRGPGLADGWLAVDVPAGFIAPVEPLMVDGGRVDPTLPSAARVSEPAIAAGRALAEQLGADPDGVAEGTAVPGATTLGAVESAPVAELVEHALRSSDNVLAEALAREVAIARGGEPTFAGAAEQILAALSQAGFDPSGAVLADGSGLSTEDKVPARLLGALLAAAAAPARGSDDIEVLRPILTGLPVAGGDGTLDGRFDPTAASAAGRGVVRAKTGTLDVVSSLAGVVTDVDGRLLVFALMSNGVLPTVARPRLDEMAATLGGCGCR